MGKKWSLKLGSQSQILVANIVILALLSTNLSYCYTVVSTTEGLIEMNESE